MLRRGRRVQCDVVWEVSGQGKEVVQLGFELGVRSLDIMDNEILTVAEHHLCLNVRSWVEMAMECLLSLIHI